MTGTTIPQGPSGGGAKTETGAAGGRWQPELLAAIVLLAFLLSTLHRQLGPIVALAGLAVLVYPIRSERWARLLLAAATLLTALWAIGQLTAVLAPLAAAFILAYVLDPIVDRLERLRWPRPLAAGTLIAIAAIVVIGAIALVVPWLNEAARALARSATNLSAGGIETLRPWLDRLPSERVTELARQVVPSLIAWVQKLGSTMLHALSAFGQGFSVLANALAFLVITPVLLFYLLVDIDRIRDGILANLPLRSREEARSFLSELDTMLAAYFRGQLLVSACVGIASGLLLAIAGLPKALTIGLLTGLLNLVPVIGFWIALSIALFTAAFGATDPFPLVYWVLAIYVGVQQLEGQVLSPRIVGREVGLHPVAILMGLVVFGKLFGFVGVLTAIPLTALTNMVATRLLRVYHRSRIYAGEGPPAE
jgi:predicted PurR-regulated permease PerM